MIDLYDYDTITIYTYIINTITIITHITLLFHHLTFISIILDPLSLEVRDVIRLGFSLML